MLKLRKTKLMFMKFCMPSVSVSALILLSGCASSPPISSAAAKVQILSESNTMAATCKKIAPFQISHGRIAPGDSVYDEAVDKVKESAAVLGADSVVILDNKYTPGLTNHFLINATALKCY